MNSHWLTNRIRCRAAGFNLVRPSLAKRAAIKQRAGGSGLQKRKRRRGQKLCRSGRKASSPVGGGCRAFIRVKSLGGKGKPNFGELTQRYNLLSDEEKKVYIAMGGSATASNKRQYGSAFGSIPRRALIKAKQQSRKGQFQHAYKCDPRNACQSFIKMGMREGKSMDALLSDAKLAGKLKHQQQSKEAGDIDKLIADFRSSADGAGIVLNKLLEGSGLPVGSFQHIPVPNAVVFFALGELSTPQKVMAWASANHKATNLDKVAASAHDQLMSTIMEADTEPVNTLGAEKLSKCQDALRCVCCGSGRHLFTIRNSCIRFLKDVFPIGSLDRKRVLVDGFVVLQFIGSLQQGGASSSSADVVEISTVLVQETWAHIGLQYLSPFRPTISVMGRDPSNKPLHEDPSPEWIMLKATPKSQSAFVWHLNCLFFKNYVAYVVAPKRLHCMPTNIKHVKCKACVTRVGGDAVFVFEHGICIACVLARCDCIHMSRIRMQHNMIYVFCLCNVW